MIEGGPPVPPPCILVEANPDVEAQVRGIRFAARAEPLSDAEKQAVWDDVRRAIPQMNVYEKRTDRKIRLFRIRRREP